MHMNQVIGEADEHYMRAEALADPNNGKFTIKMKDVAISASFEFLRGKG